MLPSLPYSNPARPDRPPAARRRSRLRARARARRGLWCAAAVTPRAHAPARYAAFSLLWLSRRNDCAGCARRAWRARGARGARARARARDATVSLLQLFILMLRPVRPHAYARRLQRQCNSAHISKSKITQRHVRILSQHLRGTRVLKPQLHVSCMHSSLDLRSGGGEEVSETGSPSIHTTRFGVCNCISLHCRDWLAA